MGTVVGHRCNGAASQLHADIQGLGPRLSTLETTGRLDGARLDGELRLCLATAPTASQSGMS